MLGEFFGFAVTCLDAFFLRYFELSSCLKRGLSSGWWVEAMHALTAYNFFLGTSNLKSFRHRRGGIELYKAFSSSLSYYVRYVGKQFFPFFSFSRGNRG